MKTGKFGARAAKAAAKRFYPRRTSGRHCDHRHFDRHAVAQPSSRFAKRLGVRLVPTRSAKSSLRFTTTNRLFKKSLRLHSFQSMKPMASPKFHLQRRSMGWSTQAQILPYLEEANLSSTINYKIGYKDHPPVNINGELAQITRFRIDTYLCPSEVNDRRRGEGTDEENYPLNYAWNGGLWFVYSPVTQEVGQGVFGLQPGHRISRDLRWLE